MLYTFSRADLPERELNAYFSRITEQDAVVLWQDGVLLALKYPHYFTQCQGLCAALENDMTARNLTALLPKESQVRLISMADLVAITEQFTPQLVL